MGKQQEVAVHDGGCDVAEFAAAALGVVAQPLERLVGVDRLTGHEDPFGLFDLRAAPPNAPWRFWYSLKRWSVISIAL